MASVGLIRETGVDLFDANKKCQNLATPEAVTIVTHLLVKLLGEVKHWFRR